MFFVGWGRIEPPTQGKGNKKANCFGKRLMNMFYIIFFVFATSRAGVVAGKKIFILQKNCGEKNIFLLQTAEPSEGRRKHKKPADFLRQADFLKLNI